MAQSGRYKIHETYHCPECNGAETIIDTRMTVAHKSWCIQGERARQMRAGERPWQQGKIIRIKAA
jgi:hypothetical protein